MDLEAKIQSLLAFAAPLRLLHEDDPEKARLAKVIDQINALRKEQEQAVHLGAPPMENPRTGPTSTRVIDANAVVEGSDAVMTAPPLPAPPPPGPPPPAKRKPGRPAKAKP